MYSLIIQLTTAHFLGDFVLQSDKMVQDIAAKKFRSKYLYLHALIHFVLLLIFTGLHKEYLLPSLLLAIAHLVIDMGTKIYLAKKISSVLNLIIDQGLHFICIAIFVNYYYPYTIDYNLIFSTQNQLLCIAIIGLSYVSAIVIKKIIELFDYNVGSNGLKDAGKYIGILERFFVFFFVVSNFWEGIGFLLAAKSIFRFGDLKQNKDVKLTEYILIGTLLSFALAIAIGKIYLMLVEVMV